jgi:hypothetical protein
MKECRLNEGFGNGQMDSRQDLNIYIYSRIRTSFQNAIAKIEATFGSVERMLKYNDGVAKN